MAYSDINGPANVRENGDDSADPDMVGWNLDYLTLREQAVDYPVEETSPPATELPDFRMRKIDYHCDECGERLNVYTALTDKQEAEIWLRWTSYHSHTTDE